MKRQIKGVLNGTIASASYGTNPLFALPLFASGIGVNSVLFYRYAIAVVIFGLWLKFVKKISLRINFKEFSFLFILGLLFSLSSLTLFEAFRYIEAGIACTILFIYPVLVAIIMAMFFRERMSFNVIVSIFLTSLGIVLLYHGGGSASLNIHGVSVVFASALLYALYIVGVKNIKTIRHINSLKMSFYVMLFGLLVYVVNLDFGRELQILNSPLLWGYVLGLALFPTIISLETINIAIKLIGSTKTAILGALEPLTAIFIGILFFDEHLTLRISIGVLLILFGVILAVTRKQTYKNSCTS